MDSLKIENELFISLASLAFSSLQSYHMHRFEQSRELSKSIKTDVLECLKEINKNQGIDYKRLLTDGKKLEKELKNNMDQVEKVLFLVLNLILLIT